MDSGWAAFFWALLQVVTCGMVRASSHPEYEPIPSRDPTGEVAAAAADDNGGATTTPPATLHKRNPSTGSGWSVDSVSSPPPLTHSGSETLRKPGVVPPAAASAGDDDDFEADFEADFDTKLAVRGDHTSSGSYYTSKIGEIDHLRAVAQSWSSRLNLIGNATLVRSLVEVLHAKEEQIRQAARKQQLSAEQSAQLRSSLQEVQTFIAECSRQNTQASVSQAHSEQHAASRDRSRRLSRGQELPSPTPTSSATTSPQTPSFAHSRHQSLYGTIRGGAGRLNLHSLTAEAGGADAVFRSFVEAALERTIDGVHQRMRRQAEREGRAAFQCFLDDEWARVERVEGQSGAPRLAAKAALLATTVDSVSRLATMGDPVWDDLRHAVTEVTSNIHQLFDEAKSPHARPALGGSTFTSGGGGGGGSGNLPKETVEALRRSLLGEGGTATTPS